MRKVLIVEDNDKNLKLIRVLMKSHGYETVEAVNGEEGIALAKSEKPDLILMDIRMPVMDGVAAISTLKEDEDTKDIPIIALTAHAMRDDREKYLAEGFDDYITKPIDINHFSSIVKKFL